MLEGLLKHEKLGSAEEIEFLVRGILSQQPVIHVSDARVLCEKKSRDSALSFNGIIDLLVSSEIIDLNNGVITLNSVYQLDAVDLKKEIIHKIISLLQNSGVLSDFIRIDSIRYDANSELVGIKNNLIPTKYAPIKHLLSSLGLFKARSSLADIIYVEPSYSEYFEFSILKILKKEIDEKDNFRLSLEQLKKIQEIKELYGKEAEEFALSFEQKRLFGHPNMEKIRLISDLGADAGYDLVSFNSTSSERIDRFIEVKSYSSFQKFYWSKNEVSQAMVKRDSYFLYLVDRTKIKNPRYVPMIVQNPYEHIFLNKEWTKEVQNWLFSKD